MLRERERVTEPLPKDKRAEVSLTDEERELTKEKQDSFSYTTHDAAPAAKARTDADRDRTDKAATRPGKGTGDNPDSRTRLSEAEIDALEFVVEEGRIASMDDYGILRSLLVRVRPEWETADSVLPFSKRETDSPQPVKRTPQPHATPGEGSLQGEGTLTDEERAAILASQGFWALEDSPHAATLRALLERLA
jgi:hypothetical protein